MSHKAKSDIQRKLKAFKHARESGNISKTCRYFGILREIFYRWKRAYEKHGERALINSNPCPENPNLRTPPEIDEKILYVRKNYYLGQLGISWYYNVIMGLKYYRVP